MTEPMFMSFRYQVVAVSGGRATTIWRTLTLEEAKARARECFKGRGSSRGAVEVHDSQAGLSDKVVAGILDDGKEWSSSSDEPVPVFPLDADTSARSLALHVFGEPHEQLETATKYLIAEVVAANERIVRDRVLALVAPEPCDAETMPKVVAPSNTCQRCIVREAFNGRKFPLGHPKRDRDLVADECERKPS